MRQLARRSAEFKLSLRVTAASILAYALATILTLPQGFWAVLTAMVVVQGSVGGSLKAAVDRFIGTLGGAAYAALVATLVPHTEPATTALALALIMAPLAFAAALHASFKVAPLTAIVVLLGSTSQTMSPLMSAAERIIEIGVGSIVGLAVSLVVLPARAHGLVVKVAGRLLASMADLGRAQMAGLDGRRDPQVLQALVDRTRLAMNKLEAVVRDARRERASRLTDEPDPDPLLRALRRVRSDLVMLGRAVGTALPAPLADALANPAHDLANAMTQFLASTGTALTSRGPLPPLDAVTAAQASYAAAWAEARRGGLTRALPDEAASRIFGLAFVFEQLCNDLDDLASRAAELSKGRI